MLRADHHHRRTSPPKTVTGSFASANKTYDGTTDASATARSVAGTLPGDVVTLSGGTATFADKNVGTGKTVTLTGATLGGADAGNYALSVAPITTTAEHHRTRAHRLLRLGEQALRRHHGRLGHGTLGGRHAAR